MPIESVIVNGEDWTEKLGGYLDIGLIDTMGDMMIETFGAVVYAVVFALVKGRHPAFTRVGAVRREASQTVLA